MSKDKHTPGPWHYGGHANIYAFHQRELLHSRVVACVPAAEVDGGKKERQANARLIAGGRVMNTRIYDSRGECDPGATIRKFRIVQTEGSRQVDNARAAISKAEVRS